MKVTRGVAIAAIAVAIVLVVLAVRAGSVEGNADTSSPRDDDAMRDTPPTPAPIAPEVVADPIEVVPAIVLEGAPIAEGSPAEEGGEVES